MRLLVGHQRPVTGRRSWGRWATAGRWSNCSRKRRQDRGERERSRAERTEEATGEGSAKEIGHGRTCRRQGPGTKQGCRRFYQWWLEAASPNRGNEREMGREIENRARRAVGDVRPGVMPGGRRWCFLAETMASGAGFRWPFAGRQAARQGKRVRGGKLGSGEAERKHLTWKITLWCCLLPLYRLLNRLTAKTYPSLSHLPIHLPLLTNPEHIPHSFN